MLKRTLNTARKELSEYLHFRKYRHHVVIGPDHITKFFRELDAKWSPRETNAMYGAMGATGLVIGASFFYNSNRTEKKDGAEKSFENAEKTAQNSLTQIMR